MLIIILIVYVPICFRREEASQMDTFGQCVIYHDINTILSCTMRSHFLLGQHFAHCVSVYTTTMC